MPSQSPNKPALKAANLLERIDERLEALGGKPNGKTRYWLSKEISDGRTGKIFTDIERRDTMPGGERLRRIADTLGVTADALIAESATPALIASEVTFHELRQPFRRPGAEGIKVLGSGLCADLIIEDDGDRVEIEQLQLEVDHTVRMIERPAALWNARDAYAIYFQGSSMERRFYQGELGIVDPSRQRGRGDIVLVKLTNGDGSTIVQAVVKELVRESGSYVELLQYNPETRFRLPRSRVASIERVLRPDELLYL